MKVRFVILLALLALSSSTSAHRLNEYLQATTINLSRGSISIVVRLTPGVDVAAAVLKGIDLDGDNRLSPSEQRAYVAQLARDLSLTLDGRHTALTPVSFSFPPVEAMRKGIGDIVVEYDAPMAEAAASHRLELKSVHYSPIAVYLVNCLLPADAGIHVAGQTRSADQSVYQLDFTTGYVGADTPAALPQSTGHPDYGAVVNTYFVHGIRHILTGYDHLLFLCALVLGAAGLWDLIKIVTAFTIAHSITLTLATLGLAHLPEQVVEPIISASIVFVAIQNIYWPEKANGTSRLAVAFFFGLFHGLGFAGGLLALMHAMPTHLVFYAILGFSLGVEAGNQIVLLPLYGLLQSIRLFQRKAARPPKIIPFRRFASGAVAIAGLYYLCVALVPGG